MNNSVFTTSDIVKYLIITGIVYTILKVIFDKSKNANQSSIKIDASELIEKFKGKGSASKGSASKGQKSVARPSTVVDYKKKKK
jgi:hypothetical protein